MNTKAITIRSEVGTIDDIDALAKAMDRSRNYVVNQAMISFVANSISPGYSNGDAAESFPPTEAKASSGAKKKDKKKKKKSAKKSKKK